MQSELEKTQLEIAKAQLEQERIKLSKMQRNQKALNSLGQGAAVLGEGATRGAAGIMRFIGRWLLMLLFAVTVIAMISVWYAMKSQSPFTHALGYFWGSYANQLFVILSVCPLVGAFFRRKHEDGMVVTAGLGIVIFVAWAFLR